MPDDVVHDLAELPQAIRLPQNEAVEDDAHDERPPVRLFKHLVELVNEVVAEQLRWRAPRDTLYGIVQIMRIRDGQDAAMPGGEPYRLIIDRPIHHVFVPILLEQLQRPARLAYVRREPSLRRDSLMATDGLSHLFYARDLFLLRHVYLPFGIG